MIRKKLQLFALLASFFVTQSFAQTSNWTWQNPTPTGEDITHSVKISTTTAYFSTAKGNVFKTENAAETWVMHTVKTGAEIDRLHFIDENNGYATTDSGLFKTTDAALTWNLIESNLSIYQTLSDVWFFDATNGIGIRTGKIYKTTDGGTTWVSIDHPGSSSYKYDVYFIDNNTGFVVGGNGTNWPDLLKTTDGGDTWTQTSDQGGIHCITFVNATTGFAVGESGLLLKTTDTGDTWTTYSGLQSKTIYSVEFTDENNGVAVGERYIYSTTDGGSTWTETHSGEFSETYKTAISFSSTNTLALGINGLSNISKDGGTTWDGSNNFTQKITDIVFTSTTTGYIALDNGPVMKTTDKGDNWNAVSSDLFKYANTLLVEGDKILIGGSVGLLYLSEDGGTSWTDVSSESSGINTIEKVSDNLIFAGGYGGKLQKSTNGGSSWTSVTSPTSKEIKDIKFVDENNGLLVGGESTSAAIFKTTDGGSIWTEITSPVAKQLFKTCFIDVNNAFIVGDGGTILKTTDGGSSFSQITLSGFEYIEFNAIDFADAINGMIVGEYGVVLTTSDGGATWTQDKTANELLENSLFAVDMVNTVRAYVGGYSGSLLKYQTGDDPTPPAPVAAFSADVTSGDAPLTVAFTDASTGDITSWKWYIDDATTEFSTSQSPSHEFTEAGTYSIKLVVSDGTNSDDTVMTDLITVNEVIADITAAFSSNKTSGDAPLEVSFTDASTGDITSWSWDFDNDGSADATTQNPTYTYETAGTYTVSLTVSDGTTSDTETKTSYITVNEVVVPIDAEFSADVTSGDAPLTVNFTDESTGDVTTWSWDFDNDGTEDSQEQNPTYTYTVAGTYTVLLTVTDGMIGSNEQKTDYITVNEGVVTCLNPSNYFTGYETEGDRAGWGAYNANEDESTWGFFNDAGVGDGIGVAYKFHSTNSADDWLVSPCFDMVAGKNYEISFFYAAANSDFTEKLNVMYGSGGLLDQNLVDLGEFNNTDFTESKTTISITSSDSYTFGWHCTSDADMSYAIVDNVSIKEVEETSITQSIDATLTIYPNPAKNLVNIKLDGTQSSTTISIYNSNGMLVYQTEVDANSRTMQLNISKFNKGLYIVKTTNNGSNKVARLMVN
ncbi:MAG: PKD domain-containing protein [Salinivirgaceae bacterium]|jgi:PKD repeat protein|nr:PKD domain-containing protein [Salinivirgaceae bacterium]